MITIGTYQNYFTFHNGQTTEISREL